MLHCEYTNRGCPLALVFFLVLCGQSMAQEKPEVPKVVDPRLVVELFAAAPQIKHPIGLDFDSKGRLLVIESHTHFPPAGYQGLKHDRILRLEDTDGDGKADRFTTFFEGTRHTMDIAVHPDGSVYLATRNEILRLRDTNDSGKADEKQRLVFLETKGDYPHNGLSGLCFDSQGNLLFGMGENLGASFKLVGADGVTITGEGDGGHIFRCSADGDKLRKMATGFWNPFGICRDIFGRTFAVDNDPDAMPPCRLLHIVEGGDYGFQFRYGRQGRHPFQAWNGELPGTLPMISGTGEAPCEVLSYESDGLPAEYLGNLLVTSWADHRVERYRLKEKGASFTSQREPFVQGGKDFHPVGMAVAPDGSLFVSDWVLRDYNLHGKGAIWHIRAKEKMKPARPEDPRQALLSLHRPLRERAARLLAADDAGRLFLRQQISDSKGTRPRAAALTALLDKEDALLDSRKLAGKGSDIGVRELAIRGLLARDENARPFLSLPSLKMAGMASLEAKDLLGLLAVEADPFLRHAAIQQLARPDKLHTLGDGRVFKDSRVRLGMLLAHRFADGPDSRKLVPAFLADPDEDIRFLAAKWIADQKLAEHRPLVAEAMKDPKLNVRLYWAYATALARLDGQEVNEGRLADYFFERVTDERSTPAARLLALQLVPARHGRLTLNVLRGLVKQPSETLQLEAVRALAEHPDPKRTALLLAVLRDGKLAEDVRAQAIVGLADQAPAHLDELLDLAKVESPRLRDEALRALTNTALTQPHKDQLAKLAALHPETAELAARALGKFLPANRLPTKDVDGWLKRLEGPADAQAGRRIFAHPRLTACFRCHRVEGRGNDIGPDLSTIGRTERRGILESILQPSNNVAPHYQTWLIETADGKVRTGLLMHTHLDECTYLDEKGGRFKVNTREVASTRAVPTSIMPDGLVNQLTDQEIRDLLAYLCGRR